MPEKGTSKAQAVRDYLKANPKAKNKSVAEALGNKNIKVTPHYVGQVKRTRRKKNGKRSVSSTSSSSKRKPWTFPRNTLEDAISIPKAIEEKNAGNPMRANDLSKAIGYKMVTDWRFGDLLRSANQYGLVSGAGKTATVRIEKLGQDIVAPSSPKERQTALLEAFNSIPTFKAVTDFYGNKRIPEDEFFLNTLTREFNISRDRVETFSEVFLSNLEYLRWFDVAQAEKPAAGASNFTAGPEGEKPSIERLVSKQPRVREFLDTCFVMMPFGEWFDKYYQHIYIPAIKDAGFEPIRADELFATGTVVEQIWEQIRKSKVLLADLTDRNANVFYELGLAHAARKPVVFTAPCVDDVPFDLRHLRVIIYEIREPEWSSKLKSKVTDYLKNSLKDPEKSIPHPFRGEPED